MAQDPKPRTPVTPVTPSVSATPHTPHGASLAPQGNPRTPANTARKAFLWEAASKSQHFADPSSIKSLQDASGPFWGKITEVGNEVSKTLQRFSFCHGIHLCIQMLFARGHVFLTSTRSVLPLCLQAPAKCIGSRRAVCLTLPIIVCCPELRACYCWSRSSLQQTRTYDFKWHIKIIKSQCEVKLYNRHQAVKPKTKDGIGIIPLEPVLVLERAQGYPLPEWLNVRCGLRWSRAQRCAKRISSRLTVRITVRIGHDRSKGPRRYRQDFPLHNGIWMYLAKLNSKVTGSLRAGLITCYLYLSFSLIHLVWFNVCLTIWCRNVWF